MKKLLTFLTLLTLFFTVGWAETKTATLSWAGNGGNGDGSVALNSTTIFTVNGGGYYTGDANIATATTVEKVYTGKSNNGLKLGSGNAIGKMVFSINGNYKPSKITVEACPYSTTEKTLKIIVNGETSLTYQTTSLTDGFHDYEVTMDGNTTLNTIEVSTTTKRAYVDKITITYEEGATPSVDAPSISFDSFSNGDTEATANITEGSNSSTTYFKVGENGTYAATNGTETIDLTSVEAPFTVYAYSSDGTNNSTEVSATFSLPTLRVNVSPASYTGYDEQTVTITPTNYVGTPVVTYKINGGTEETYSSPFTLSNVGTYEVVAYVMDERANGTVVNSETSTITIAEQPSGETVTATYIFNDADELEALGITLPSASSGTSIAGDEYLKGSVTFTSTNGTNAQNPTRIWNSSGSYDLRLYSGATFTLSVPSNCTITNIAITGSAVSAVSPSIGTYSNGTWVGEAQEVVFTAS